MLLFATPIGAASHRHIANGDVAALQAAFAAAAETDAPLRVVLARGGSYTLERGLRLRAGTLNLEGNGARIRPAGSSGTSLFTVDAGATLRVDHLVVAGESSAAIGIPMTDVAGELALHASTFDGLVGSVQPHRPDRLVPLNRVAPGARVRLENVTLRRIEAPCIQIGRGCQASYPVWAVAGELVLDSSTLGRVAAFAQPGMRALDGGRIVVRNSLEVQPAIVCGAGIISESGNVWAQDACAGSGDRVETRDADVSLPSIELRGGLVPTLAWRGSGYPPAIGHDCLPTDARGAVRPAQGCTPGALELNAQFGDARLIGGEGGAGVWYDPENDGHYLQIQPLPDAQMLLTWMHFDQAGRPAWAYLVAASDGGRLAGEALRNRSIGATEGLHAAEAEPWGQLDVQFEDCDRLRLRYASIDGGPGSGDVVLRRLTALPDVGCR